MMMMMLHDNSKCGHDEGTGPGGKTSARNSSMDSDQFTIGAAHHGRSPLGTQPLGNETIAGIKLIKPNNYYKKTIMITIIRIDL